VKAMPRALRQWLLGLVSERGLSVLRLSPVPFVGNYISGCISEGCVAKEASHL